MNIDIEAIASALRDEFQRAAKRSAPHLFGQLLEMIGQERNEGSPSTLLRHVPVEPAFRGTKQFELIQGDGIWRADELVIGPSMAGISTSRPAFQVRIAVNKDVAIGLAKSLDREDQFMSTSFFDGILMLPTEFNEPGSTCGGGVFQTLPPHRQSVELFYQHDDRVELCRLIRHVAGSAGMSPAEHRRWLNSEAAKRRS